MNKHLRTKLIAYLLIFSMLFSIVSCGFILYPERRGRTQGRIDPVVLVLDCLWLIPGIIPGVVALVVDFVTGGIYQSGSAINIQQGQQFALDVHGPAPTNSEITVTLSNGDGTYSQTLLTKKFSAGEEMTSQVSFQVPPEISEGVYILSLQVDDKTTSSWTLFVSGQ